MNGEHCFYLLYKSKGEVKYNNIEDIDVKPARIANHKIVSRRTTQNPKP